MCYAILRQNYMYCGDIGGELLHSQSVVGFSDCRDQLDKSLESLAMDLQYIASDFNRVALIIIKASI